MATITTTVRAARDGELKFSPSGAAFYEISAAENHQRKNRDTGQWEDTGTTWWRVKAFGKTAENLAEARITKGTLLLVTGRSETREYEKRDGTKGTSLELIADTIAIIPTPTFRDNRTVHQKATGSFPTGNAPEDPWAA